MRSSFSAPWAISPTREFFRHRHSLRNQAFTQLCAFASPPSAPLHDNRIAVVSRKKIDLAKVLNSLNVTCPECGYSIPPNEVMRLGNDRIPSCDFVLGLPKT